MTLELVVLLLAALLAASLWIPYIVGVNTTEFAGQEASFQRPPDQAAMLPWIHRSYRAHQNLLEQLLPFAIVVLVAQSLGVSTGVTQAAALAFLVLRIGHAVGMITGVATFPVRPLLFVAGWATILVIAWQVLAHAPQA